jgi:hypothetical protein
MHETLAPHKAASGSGTNGWTSFSKSMSCGAFCALLASLFATSATSACRACAAGKNCGRSGTPRGSSRRMRKSYVTENLAAADGADAASRTQDRPHSQNRSQTLRQTYSTCADLSSDSAATELRNSPLILAILLALGKTEKCRVCKARLPEPRQPLPRQLRHGLCQRRRVVE